MRPGAVAATHHYVDFEGLAAGTSVEGAGAVDPVLTITSLPWGAGTPSCTVGSAAVIEEGNPFPFVAYGTPAAIDNGCLTGVHGFADDADCVLDYEFTFASGHTASCFSMRILDYGDYFPYGGTNHIVQLAAFDASNVLVDQDVFTVTGAVDATGGDACSTGPNAVGNHLLAVAGPGIVRVTLRFNAFPDEHRLRRPRVLRGRGGDAGGRQILGQREGDVPLVLGWSSVSRIVRSSAATRPGGIERAVLAPAAATAPRSSDGSRRRVPQPRRGDDRTPPAARDRAPLSSSPAGGLTGSPPARARPLPTRRRAASAAAGWARVLQYARDFGQPRHDVPAAILERRESRSSRLPNPSDTIAR